MVDALRVAAGDVGPVDRCVSALPAVLGSEGVAAALHKEELARDAVRELVARDAVRELVERDAVAADVLADRCVRAAARRAVDPDRERARRDVAIAAADTRGADDRTSERAGDGDGSRPEEGKEKLESSSRFFPFA